MSKCFTWPFRCFALATLCGCAATPPGSPPQKPAAKSRPDTNSIEQLTSAARDSLVVITHYGRDGREDGVGTGFVIAPDGLIATSLHVIGEARSPRPCLSPQRCRRT